jgi:hypothetical protein
MNFVCKNRAGALTALAALETQTSGAVNAGIRAVRKWVDENTESPEMPEETRRHLEEWVEKCKEDDAAAEQRIKEFWDKLSPEFQRAIAPVLNDLDRVMMGLNVLPHNEYMEIDPDYIPPPRESYDEEDEG